MIIHKAIGQNLDMAGLAIGVQPREIGATVAIGKKCLLASIAPLGNVMGEMWKSPNPRLSYCDPAAYRKERHPAFSVRCRSPNYTF